MRDLVADITAGAGPAEPSPEVVDELVEVVETSPTDVAEAPVDAPERAVHYAIVDHFVPAPPADTAEEGADWEIQPYGWETWPEETWDAPVDPSRRRASSHSGPVARGGLRVEYEEPEVEPDEPADEGGPSWQEDRERAAASRGDPRANGTLVGAAADQEIGQTEVGRGAVDGLRLVPHLHPRGAVQMESRPGSLSLLEANHLTS